MDDLEMWVADQLRTGLSGMLADLAPWCREIAARMVDGKAQALAGRLDEIPAQLMTLPGEERLDALIGHLGKLVLSARAFRGDTAAPDVRWAVANSETREAVLGNPDALRIEARWELAGERILTRREGLVSQSRWLLNLDDGPQRLALLLDFFPASIGKRSSAFAAGDQFIAELAFTAQTLRPVPGSLDLEYITRSYAFRELCKLIRKVDDAVAERTLTTGLANLGLITDAAPAAGLITTFTDKGVMAAEPRLAMLRLNASLKE